jgi:hypothetical protein
MVHFRRGKPGINVNVHAAIQHSLQKMSGKDNYCCLMFNEMSIREKLHFNSKFDRTEGLGIAEVSVAHAILQIMLHFS